MADRLSRKATWVSGIGGTNCPTGLAVSVVACQRIVSHAKMTLRLVRCWPSIARWHSDWKRSVRCAAGGGRAVGI